MDKVKFAKQQQITATINNAKSLPVEDRITICEILNAYVIKYHKEGKSIKDVSDSYNYGRISSLLEIIEELGGN